MKAPLLATVVGMLLLTVATSARSQTVDGTCFDVAPAPELRVAACTVLIDGGALTGAALAAAYLERGNAYDRLGRSGLAIADFGSAISADPGYAEAYYNRGTAYHEAGRNDLAILDYTNALQLDPSSVSAYNNRGNAYHLVGQNVLAIADYDRALLLAPGDAAAYDNRGIAHHASGESELAVLDYTEALRLDPSDARAYKNRGNVFADLGRIDAALADYGQALQIDPADATACKYRGYVFFNVGRFRDAARDFERSVRLRPDAYGVLWLRIARARTGNDDPAGFAARAAALGDVRELAPLFDFYLGKRTESQATAAASGPGLCETVFYIAEWHRFHGADAAARQGFQRALDACPRSFVEYDTSRAELAR